MLLCDTDEDDLLCDSVAAREIRTALAPQYFLEGMSEVRRARLLHSASTHVFAAGQTLFHRGDMAESFFVVLEGRVKLYRLSIDGDEKIMGLVGAGGIGQELKTAFDLFQYQKASAIILAVFVIVLAMEWLTDRLRARAR